MQKSAGNSKPLSHLKEFSVPSLAPIAVGLISLVFFILILRRAWLCDDAYITFRTVDNLVHGYKLTWNTIERVQAYTHPLWMMLLSLVYFLTKDIYHTALALSLTLSSATVLVYGLKLVRNRFLAFAGILILSLSNAFIDYSTSGLENPLTNLLLVVFFYFFFSLQPSNKKLFILSVTASLAGVNRLDCLLFYFPAILYSLWEVRTLKGFFFTVIGQFPLLLWECFSLFYYGFPFPNTYYAKLNTGISSIELFKQGLFYFQNSIQRDPLTLLSILVGILLAFISRRPKPLAMAIGVLLYLIYILKIGGDFMSGRFFVAPLLCAVIIIAWSAPDNMRTLSRIIILAMVLTTGLLAEIPTFRLLPSQTQQITDSHGITDERVWYYSDFALFSPERNNDLSLTAGKNGAKARAEAGDDLYVIAVNNTGVFGFYAGPYVYVVDQLALSEPLLARLPAIQKVNWRIGHFTRLLPAGYISAIYGLGKLDDEGLAQYYEKLHLITSGKLSDPQRLVEIWRINTGYYDSLIDYDAYRYPDMVRTTLTEMKDLTTKSQGTQHAVGSRLYFYDSGIDIDLNAEYHFGQYSLCLDSDDDYRIQYLNETGIVASQDHPKTSDTSTMKCQQVNIPSKAIRNGFTHIRIFPDAGNGDYSTGGLDLIDINP